MRHGVKNKRLQISNESNNLKWRMSHAQYFLSVSSMFSCHSSFVAVVHYHHLMSLWSENMVNNATALLRQLDSRDHVPIQPWFATKPGYIAETLRGSSRGGSCIAKTRLVDTFHTTYHCMVFSYCPALAWCHITLPAVDSDLKAQVGNMRTVASDVSLFMVIVSRLLLLLESSVLEDWFLNADAFYNSGQDIRILREALNQPS